MKSDKQDFLVLTSPGSDAQIRMSMSAYDDSFARAIWSEECLSFYTIQCLLGSGHGRAGSKLTSPLMITLTEGRVGDVVWTNYHDLIINRRTLDVLNSASITGYSTQPVQCGPEERYLLTATGWGGMASNLSKIERVSYCESCGYVHYRVRAWPSGLVDTEQWDGSDVFMVWPLPKIQFVTPRVAEELSKAKISGISCVPEMYIIRRSSAFSPGRLSNYMELKKAIAHGKSSKILEV